MEWKMFYQVLIEAEARMNDERWPLDVRERSAETVSLCKQRMAMEGITRDQLKALAKK